CEISPHFCSCCVLRACQLVCQLLRLIPLHASVCFPHSMATQDKTFDLLKADTADSNVEVVFLALGSIGDCLPLCALASSLGSLGVDSDRSRRQDEQDVHEDEGELQQSQVDADRVDRAHRCAHRCDDRDFKRRRKRRNPSSAAVGVVTHRCHCDLLEGLMEGTFDVSQPPPRLYPVDVPVLFGVSNNDDGEDASASAGRSGERREAQQRVNANGAARGQRTARVEDLAVAAADVGDEEGAIREELDACMSVLEDLKPKLLVFNLYSAFGYHLADALGIPCVCASPGVAPSGGGVALGRVLPRALLERINGRVGDGDGDASNGNEITRADLELWMLPLFLPRYRRWRQGRGLPDISSPTGSSLPRAPPILFGVSPAVLPRPGYWPARADVCGFWSFPRLSPRYRPPDRLVRFLARCEADNKPVFVVGLGSMPALGLVQDPSRIVATAASSLQRAGAAVILLPTPPAPAQLKDDADNACQPVATSAAVGAAAKGDRLAPSAPPGNGSTRGQHKEIVAAAGGGDIAEGTTCRRDQGSGCGEVLENAETETAAAVAAVAAEPYLLDLAGELSFVPHTWLLPRCRGVVHHGGSGTTGACLSAGAVQVVIPLAWDQFFFADQVSQARHRTHL
ncbi:unnamed protein product, partial [Ectocarpus sp. 8 AP-2014]